MKPLRQEDYQALAEENRRLRAAMAPNEYAFDTAKAVFFGAWLLALVAWFAVVVCTMPVCP